MLCPSMSHARDTATLPVSLEERWQALLGVLESIGAHRSLADLLDEVAGRLGPLVGCDSVLLMVHDPAQGVVRLQLLGGRPTGLSPQSECTDGDSLTGTVIRTQEPVLIADTRVDGGGRACQELLARHGLLSSWTFPLTTSRRRLGAIGYARAQEGLPGAEEERLLTRVSNLIALAVENALNQERSQSFEEQLRAERDRLQLLLDVNAAVVSQLDLRGLVAAIAGALKRVMRFDCTSLTLYDPEDRTLELLALDLEEGDGRAREGQIWPVEGSPAGRAVETRRPASFDRAALEALDSELARGLLADGVRAVLSVPLIVHDRVLGALGVASLEERTFSASDVALLSQVANQVAPAVQNACSYCELRALKDKLAREKVYLETELQHEFAEIVGHSPALQRVLQAVETVAPTDSTVLINGETGTGKELIARAIHALSGRKQGTFVKLNCAAIPSGLLESELFGHEKGAFTGALSQRIGRFELADGGTLFLDEVGDMPPELQPKLLRVLQERELERLGGNKTIKVDVRVVVATHRDLARMVAERAFRSDLYYRLNVFPLELPPLRERVDDIPLLVRHFLARFTRRMQKTIDQVPEETMQALRRHDWPGNIRELENLVERAVILSRGRTLEVPLAAMLPPTPPAVVTPAPPVPAEAQAPAASANPVTLADAERAHIVRALEETGWVVGGPKGAASRLGMSRTTLQAKMQRLGIKRPG